MFGDVCIKQMAPSSLDEYIAEHKAGDVVSGRMKEVSGGFARVELGEGVVGSCRVVEQASPEKESPAPERTSAARADVSSLSSMLQARWKSGASPAGGGKAQSAQTGQIRSFRIVS